MLSQIGDTSNSVTEENKLSKRITELEIELAQTKLALVESECRNQVRVVCFLGVLFSYTLLSYHVDRIWGTGWV